MFESYKEEVTFNEERGSEDFDPQNEFYQEDMEESFKKDITSIGRSFLLFRWCWTICCTTKSGYC